MHDLVWLLVLGGLCLRFAHATESYLNGDEAQIMFPPLQHSLADVYTAGLVLPTGPLHAFVLHFISHFSTSELSLRMPSIMAGALTILVAYHWIAEAFGKAAGFVTAAIIAFAPSLIHLTVQVRPYALQMLWLACSLYFLERAFREKSAAAMRLFGVCAVLALLTMYMSIWYLMAIAGYALARIALRELPRKLVVEWTWIQVIVVAISAAAYVTHLSKLRNSQGEVFARDAWLRGSYYHPEAQSLADFVVRSTGALFSYLFANPWIGFCAIVALVGALALIVLGKCGRNRTAALALALPLVVTCAAAILNFYPYGGSRHDAFLILFVAAAVGVAISYLAKARVAILVPAVVLLVPLWLSAEERHYLDDVAALSKREQMQAALDYLAGQTPPVRTLVTDQHGSSMVSFYICRGAIGPQRAITPRINAYRCNDREILAVQDWVVPERDLAMALQDARRISPGVFRDGAVVFSMVIDPATLDGLLHSPAGASPPGKVEGLFGKILIRPI